MKKLTSMLCIIAAMFHISLHAQKIPFKQIEYPIQLSLNVLEDVVETDEPRACAILLSGGGWVDFSWTQLQDIGFALNDIGLKVIMVEYRTTSKFENATPFDALEDVQDAIAFIRSNKDKLGIKSDQIIAIGASAGAQLGFASYLANPRELENFTDYQPDYIISYSPVLRNDEEGYAYELIKEDYTWFSPFNVYKETDKHIPPTLIISGEEDHLIPLIHLQEFKKMADAKGDDLTLYSVKNVGHSMRNTYKGIYMQSYPILLDFLEDNNIETRPLFVKEDGQITAQSVSPFNSIKNWVISNWHYILIGLLGLGILQIFRIRSRRTIKGN